jgi:hypothetical protein
MIFFLFCVFEAIVSSPLKKIEANFYSPGDPLSRNKFAPPRVEGNTGCERRIEGFDTSLHGNGEGFQMAEFPRKPRTFKAGQKAEALRKFESVDIPSPGGKGDDRG